MSHSTLAPVLLLTSYTSPQVTIIGRFCEDYRYKRNPPPAIGKNVVASVMWSLAMVYKP